MEHSYARITIRFEDPFWVCLYERGDGGSWAACRVPFGGEPSDGEVYAWLLEHWRGLPFSPPVKGEGPSERRVSPKRARREARRQTQPSPPGTKAQQALALQREEGQEARRKRSREDREAEEARRLALRKAKRRAKHKGH